MSHWNRTFKKDELRIDGYSCSVGVWTAISDNSSLAIGTIDIEVDSINAHSGIRVTLQPLQMRTIASMLLAHATRLEVLDLESSELRQVAA